MKSQILSIDELTIDADTQARVSMQGVEVPFSFVCPDMAPHLKLRSRIAGRLYDGMFYPYGSVARHMYEQQQKRNKKRAKPHVYFIQAESGGAIKIGHANDVTYRLQVLQTGNPSKLVVIALIPNGGIDLEKKLHRRFATYRLEGEWFSCNEELTAFIEQTKRNVHD